MTEYCWSSISCLSGSFTWLDVLWEVSRILYLMVPAVGNLGRFVISTNGKDPAVSP